MEGPVKERLTGALILIAALVIVVPEMLSGPDVSASRPDAGGEAGPPLRTYELQLDTPAAAHTENQSALSPQSVPPAPPAATATATVASAAAAPPATPVAAEDSAKAQPLVQKPAAEKPVAEKPAPAVVAAPAPVVPPAVVTGGSWWVQLGSFSARENAERLGKQLRTAGFPISVSPIKSNGKELFRVRAGPVASREAATGLQSRLAAAGHKSSLVAP